MGIWDNFKKIINLYKGNACTQTQKTASFALFKILNGKDITPNKRKI